jgi:hypothetical protein
MRDVQSLLLTLLLVGMAATAVLWGYWLTKRTIGYLYAVYATTALWIGTLLVSLALLGDGRYAAIFGAVFLVGLPFAFVRDKRRVSESVTYADKRKPGMP